MLTTMRVASGPIWIAREPELDTNKDNGVGSYMGNTNIDLTGGGQNGI